MTKTTFDVIVIGLGAMGAATLHGLAQRGASVLGLEQFSLDHILGSSRGHSRVCRMCYFEHPDYVPLLRRAYERWAALQTASGIDVFHQCGGLFLGPRTGELVGGSESVAIERGLAHEVLMPDEVRTRYPMFNVSEDHVGFFEPTAGMLLTENALAAWINLAIAHGASVHGHESVRRWSPDGDGVRVETNRATYHASKVIIATGTWTGGLLGDSVPVPLEVVRQAVGWVSPRETSRLGLGVCPVWAVERPDGVSFDYGVPMVPDQVGFKIANHGPGVVTPGGPDALNRVVSNEDATTLEQAVAHHVPEAAGPLIASRVCPYTRSPDSHFVIDALPQSDGRVLIATGMSGHGFKFAPVVGEAMTDLALDGRTELPIGFLGLSRFQ